MRAADLFAILATLEPPQIRPLSPPAWVERELQDCMASLSPHEMAVLRERFKDDPEATRILDECGPTSRSVRRP